MSKSPRHTSPMLALRAAHPHRAMLEAYRRFLDWEISVLRSGRVPPPTTTWQRVALLLAARTFQLQRLLLDAATVGYYEELLPTARALLSTVVALTYIAHGTSHKAHEGKAVAYLVFGRKARRRQLAYWVRKHWFTATQAKEIDDRMSKEEDDFLDDARLAGHEPIVVGPQKTRFWTGYDDHALFKEMKALRWYEQFYGPWSDESHAQAVSLVPWAKHVGRPAVLRIGPHQRDPWYVLLPTVEFGTECMRQIDKLYRLGLAPDIHSRFVATVEDIRRSRSTGS